MPRIYLFLSHSWDQFSIRLVPLLATLLLASSCSVRWIPSDMVQFRQRVDEGLARDSAVEAIISPYRSILADRMQEVVAVGARRLSLGKPESELGNFLADALLGESRATLGEDVVVAVLNQGGIRLGELPEGPLTLGYFYELLPFENQVVALELDSTGMDQLFSKIARVGGWPLGGSIRCVIKDTVPESILINDMPLDGTKTYVVAMPDYLANGGDECSFLIPYPRRSQGELLRDLIVRHARNQHGLQVPLQGQTDGRIRQLGFR